MDDPTRPDSLLVDAILRGLVDGGVPDALMLRRVMRLRELVQEIDRELAVFQRFFVAGG